MKQFKGRFKNLRKQIEINKIENTNKILQEIKEMNNLMNNLHLMYKQEVNVIISQLQKNSCKYPILLKTKYNLDKISSHIGKINS